MYNFLSRFKSYVSVAMVACFMLLVQLQASAQVTLPDTGIVIGDYITAFAAALGAALGGIVALRVSWSVIRLAIRWLIGAVR